MSTNLEKPLNAQAGGTGSQAHTVAEKAELAVTSWKANIWYAVIWLIYLSDCADRTIVNAILPALKVEFNLTDTNLGMIGGITWLAVGLFAVPVGYMVDRWSRTKSVSIMVVIWSAATWASGLARSFGQLLTARFFVGSSEGGYNSAAYALIGAWFPQKMRGRLMGIFMMAQNIGAFVGVGLAGIIAATYGWRHVFGLFAIPGFLLAIVILFAPDYRTKKVEAGTQKETKINLREVLAHMRQTPSLILLYVIVMIFHIWVSCYLVWVATFFGRVFDLGLAKAATIVMFIGIVSALGPFIFGIVSDKLFAKSSRGRVQTIIIAASCAMVLWLISLLGAKAGVVVYFSAAFWALAHMCMSGCWGNFSTAIVELVPPHFRGFSSSFYVVSTGLTTFFGSILAGAISDKFGLLSAMFIILISSVGIGLILTFITFLRYQKDYEHVKSLGVFQLEQKKTF